MDAANDSDSDSGNCLGLLLFIESSRHFGLPIIKSSITWDTLEKDGHETISIKTGNNEK